MFFSALFLFVRDEVMQHNFSLLLTFKRVRTKSLRTDFLNAFVVVRSLSDAIIIISWLSCCSNNHCDPIWHPVIVQSQGVFRWGQRLSSIFFVCFCLLIVRKPGERLRQLWGNPDEKGFEFLCYCSDHLKLTHLEGVLRSFSKK